MVIFLIYHLIKCIHVCTVHVDSARMCCLKNALINTNLWTDYWLVGGLIGRCIDWSRRLIRNHDWQPCYLERTTGLSTPSVFRFYSKMYVNFVSFLLILGKMHRNPDSHPGDADHHITCCNFTCKCVIVKWCFISIHIQQHLSFSILRYLMYCIMSTFGIWIKFFNNLIKIRSDSLMVTKHLVWQPYFQRERKLI